MLEINPMTRFANSNNGSSNLRVIANMLAGMIHVRGEDTRTEKCWSRRGALEAVSWRLKGVSSSFTIELSSKFNLQQKILRMYQGSESIWFDHSTFIVIKLVYYLLLLFLRHLFRREGRVRHLGGPDTLNSPCVCLLLALCSKIFVSDIISYIVW